MSKFFKALKRAEQDRDQRHFTDADATPEPPSFERERVVVRPPVQLFPSAPEHRAAVDPEEPPPLLETRELSSSSGERGAITDEHLVSLLNPTAFEAEQYRTLRTLLEETRQEGHPRVVAVSSPGSGDGKTVTSINLAVVLAECRDARVLLVDADLRNPAIDFKLGIPNRDRDGLVHAIQNRALSLGDLVTELQPANLTVLPAGKSVASPYELLKSSRFAELIQEARRSYDFIVLDTPPLVSLPDCRLIGNLVDTFLIVVAANRTPKKMLEEALKMIEPAKIMGFVFNSDEQPMPGYYYNYYGRNGRGRR